MDIKLTNPQRDFFMSTAKNTAVVAGFGSGKTQVATSRMIATMISYPSINMAYLAPTYPLIRDIFYPKITEMLPQIGLGYKINKVENVVYIKGLGKIYCRTMDNPDTIVGWEVGDVFMDEFDVLKKEKAIQVFNKVSARMRQKFPNKPNQLYISTTPEGFRATYELFQRDKLEDSALVQMSTYSNPYLPADYITTLESQYPKQLIKAYLNGEFVNLTSGTIYYAFDRYKHDRVMEIDEREPIHIGMDFNVYKMAAIPHVIRDDKAYAIGEYVDLKDTPDVIESVKEDFPDRRIFAYPDASGSGTSSKSATVSDIALLRKAGFIIKARNSNPRIKNRIASVNNAFEKGNYFIDIKNCPRIAESLEQQVYDDKTGKPEKENELEHRNDALGYFIHYNWPINKPTYKV